MKPTGEREVEGHYFTKRTYDKHGEPEPLNVAQEYVLASDYDSLATAHAALVAENAALEADLLVANAQVDALYREERALTARCAELERRIGPTVDGVEVIFDGPSDQYLMVKAGDLRDLRAKLQAAERDAALRRKHVASQS